jgi:hypothetical protein
VKNLNEFTMENRVFLLFSFFFLVGRLSVTINREQFSANTNVTLSGSKHQYCGVGRELDIVAERRFVAGGNRAF